MSKVLVLRTAQQGGKSSGGFQWPASGPVECSDWLPNKEEGHGLHGLLWGRGYGKLLSNHPYALWQVVEVDADDIIDLGDFVKFPRGTVVYSGAFCGALQMVLLDKRNTSKIHSINSEDSVPSATTDKGVHSATIGRSSHSVTAGIAAHSITAGQFAKSATAGDCANSCTAGDSARSATSGEDAHSITAGEHSHSSTSGDYSNSATTCRYSCSTTAGYYACSYTAGKYALSHTTGNHGHSVTTGYQAHSRTTGESAHSATTGDYSCSSTSGKSSHSVTTSYAAPSSATGDSSIAVALGEYAVVKAGPNGVIIARYDDPKTNLPRVLVGYVGKGGVEANTWYAVDVPSRGKARWVVTEDPTRPRYASENPSDNAQVSLSLPAETEIPDSIKKLMWKSSPFPNAGYQLRHDRAVVEAYHLGINSDNEQVPLSLPTDAEIPESVRKLMWEASPFPNNKYEVRYDKAVLESYRLGLEAKEKK